MSGIDCREVEELLPWFEGGGLEPKDRLRIERHLAECERCRAAAVATREAGALFAAHPAIRDRVCTEQGEIREHVNVFVGDTVARWADGLATPIANGVEISIIPAISGG